jgi:hypothetical protein
MLYYLRGRVGKRARVAERRWGIEDDLVLQGADEPVATDSEGLAQEEAETVPPEDLEDADGTEPGPTDEAATEDDAEAGTDADAGAEAGPDAESAGDADSESAGDAGAEGEQGEEPGPESDADEEAGAPATGSGEDRA